MEKLREKEQRADLKAMANMYGLALEAQRRIPGRYASICGACVCGLPHDHTLC